MPTTHELATKIRYVIQSLDRTREITSVLSTDLQKRSVGKSAFVLVESGVAFLRRLNNLVPVPPRASKADVKEILNNIEADYEKHFAVLRGKMHAHRQELPMLDALKAWSIMHDDYIAYFREEFAIAYERIRQRDITLPKKIKPAKPLSERLKARLQKATKTSDLYFNLSKQGLFSRSGTSAMLGGAAERGQEVLDTFDVLELCQKINVGVKGTEEYTRLSAILYLVEAIAMFDTLYDDQNPDVSLREESFLDKLRNWPKPDNYPFDNWDFPVTALENAQKQIEAKSVRDRTLRNKMAAHIDADEPLPTLLLELQHYDWNALASAVIFSRQQFNLACEYGPVWLKPLARHGTPLKGVLAIDHGPEQISYD